MALFPATIWPQDHLSFNASKQIQYIHPQHAYFPSQVPIISYSSWKVPTSLFMCHHGTRRSQYCAAARSDSGPASNSESDTSSEAKPQRKARPRKDLSRPTEVDNASKTSLTTIPRKPRRGRRSEAAAVEDFVRNSLERTFNSIKEQNPDVFENQEQILKEVNAKTLSNDNDDDDDDDGDDGDDDDDQREKQMVVDEEDPNWPLDADVGWGVRASDYFEKHSIKNVVGDDGFEIDWEGEIDDSWVQEINCLEWESFAFHPSPLLVLVFERYNRATDNWKLLKEMEKALKVYWNAKDRLPPRAVKLDINIERDLAYALKVKDCPQILFLRGHKILYREKEVRSADELVHMIAYFYYKAKKPSWIDDAAVAF